MSEDRNSYSQIFKAVGIFGGTKVFQILVGIVKNKCVAVLLGPIGMGIVGLITSGLQMIKSLTSFGLDTSSIRDISRSYSSGDEDRVGRTISIFRKLVIITGLLGSVLVFALSNYLSVLSFGNTDYGLAFKIVSITLFFDQLCVGQTALMQGTFHYKLMARAALMGSIFGLIISVPLYYIWERDAIVPVIILSSLISLCVSWFYSNKVCIKKTKVSFLEALSEGKTMLVLGIAIALAGIARVGKVYGLRLFISNCGSIAEVGLYTSAMTISIQYVDVILSSMGSDYSPRLSAISDNNQLFVETINKQIKVICSLLIPLVTLFIVFARELVLLLYSNQFLEIIGMIEWMMFSMLFRAVSWCLSFPLVALGKPKLYFWNEFSSELYSIVFSICGYLIWGFDGLGIAFFITQLCFLIQMMIVSKKFYFFKMSDANRKTLITLCVFQCFLFGIIKFCSFSIWRYLLGAIIILCVCCLSASLLKEMIPLKKIIRKFKNIGK